MPTASHAQRSLGRIQQDITRAVNVLKMVEAIIILRGREAQSQGKIFFVVERVSI